jgi:hypothetical protein
VPGAVYASLNREHAVNAFLANVKSFLLIAIVLLLLVYRCAPTYRWYPVSIESGTPSLRGYGFKTEADCQMHRDEYFAAGTCRQFLLPRRRSDWTW